MSDIRCRPVLVIIHSQSSVHPQDVVHIVHTFSGIVMKYGGLPRIRKLQAEQEKSNNVLRTYARRWLVWGCSRIFASLSE